MSTLPLPRFCDTTAAPTLLPLIQQLISENINVNVTLIVSQAIYTQVAEAYLAGLEALAFQGKKLDQVTSVASIPIRCFEQAIRSSVLEEPLDRAIIAQVML